jgi:hypothetical protein
MVVEAWSDSRFVGDSRGECSLGTASQEQEPPCDVDHR